MIKKYKKDMIRRLILYSLLTFLIIIINYPFVWMVSTSFKGPKEVFIFPPPLLPKALLWQNYVEVWRLANWLRYFFNSFIISIIPALGKTFLGALAAYAFAKRFRGSQFLFYIFLGTLMIPSQSTMIPNYLIIQNFGWLNTYYALIVPSLSSAFGVFLLRQFFLTLPKELEDAAVIDGCGPFRYLFKVVLPLSKPALFTVFFLAFRLHWNILLWPLVVTNTDEMRVLQVGLALFKSETFIQWSFLMAACTFSSIPVIIAFLFIQKKIIEGISLSGLKG